MRGLLLFLGRLVLAFAAPPFCMIADPGRVAAGLSGLWLAGVLIFLFAFAGPGALIMLGAGGLAALRMMIRTVLK